MGKMPENFQFCENFCACPVGFSHLHHLNFVNSEREASKHRLHILLCFSGAFWLSLMWFFLFSERFLEGCEPSLRAAGFCNVDFMEAAQILPAVTPSRCC